MSKQHEIFSRAAAGLFPSDGDIHMEDLYQAFKARLAEELEADAKRYRHFVECGWPITFLGVEYRSKAELDAAIDNAIAEAQR